MRLVISIFDHPSAYASRCQSGEYISKAAVDGHDLSSLDTYTGLPYELEQELLTRYHTLSKPLRLPSDIWSDLSKPDDFPRVSGSNNSSRPQLNAQATEFRPGTSPTLSKKQLVHETIRPVFAPNRTVEWRFGLIQCDYLEAPVDMSFKSPVPYSKTLELPAIFEKRARSGSAQDAAFRVKQDNLDPPNSSNAGTVDLGYGIMHLYKDDDEEPLQIVRRGRSKTSTNEKDAANIDDQAGRMVAILAVPSNWATADFLQFIASSVVSIEQMRIMRDALPNRYMVLIKFRTAFEANIFIELYDSKPFSEMLIDEVCHAVKISSVQITSTKNPPYTFAFPMSGPEFGTNQKQSDHGAGKLELPTCPVCLERMDSNVSGLITVQCSHTFHCMCLQGWSNNNCPVCRYSQGRTNTDKDRLYGSALPTACAVCSATDSLWMCLVCGHVGCGRFSGRHAHAHFEETGHTFAFELESQRVWDYAGDQYVHRLIQSKTDGKLVELPSSAAAGPGTHKTGPHGAAGDEIAKIEAISIEFSDLLTSQLDSQRSYFAEKVTQLKEDLSAAEARRESATSAAKRYGAELEVLRKQQEAALVRKEAEEYALRTKLKELEDQRLPEVERENTRLEKKLEKATELARTFQKDLQAERSVTQGLLANMSKLKEENEQRKTESEQMKKDMQDLQEQVQDLMFTLTAQARVAEAGGEGGDVQVVQTTPTRAQRRGGRRR